MVQLVCYEVRHPEPESTVYGSENPNFHRKAMACPWIASMPKAPEELLEHLDNVLAERGDLEHKILAIEASDTKALVDVSRRQGKIIAIAIPTRAATTELCYLVQQALAVQEDVCRPFNNLWLVATSEPAYELAERLETATEQSRDLQIVEVAATGRGAQQGLNEHDVRWLAAHDMITTRSLVPALAAG